MTKRKKALTLVMALAIVGTATVYASTPMGDRYTYIAYNAGYSSVSDYSVTAPAAGRVVENHNIDSGSTPTNFIAQLIRVNAWYKPNDVVDTSKYPNSSNSVSGVSSGDVFRTKITSWGTNPYTEKTSYSLY